MKFVFLEKISENMEILFRHVIITVHKTLLRSRRHVAIRKIFEGTAG